MFVYGFACVCAYVRVCVRERRASTLAAADFWLCRNHTPGLCDERCAVFQLARLVNLRCPGGDGSCDDRGGDRDGDRDGADDATFAGSGI